MNRQPKAEEKFTRRTRGFKMTSGLLQNQIRKVGESRGFAVTRLLTHWAEIVGSQTAGTAIPVNISYGKGGFGATLTLLTTGSNAPFLQAELPKIKERVNACYGYAAISHIRITQTAPSGFADGQVAFQGKPKPPAPKAPETTAEARKLSADVGDSDLRSALEALAANVLSRNRL